MKLDQETEELRHKTVDMNVGKVTLNLLAGGHRTLMNLEGRGGEGRGAISRVASVSITAFFSYRGGEIVFCCKLNLYTFCHSLAFEWRRPSFSFFLEGGALSSLKSKLGNTN